MCVSECYATLLCKPQQGAVTDIELEDVSVTVIDHDGGTRPRARANNTVTHCEGMLFTERASGVEAERGALPR